MLYVNENKLTEFNAFINSYYYEYPAKEGCYHDHQTWLDDFFQKIKSYDSGNRLCNGIPDGATLVLVEYTLFRENPRFPENPFIYHQIAKRNNDTVMQQLLDFGEFRDLPNEIIYKAFSPTVRIQGICETVVSLTDDDFSSVNSFEDLIRMEIESEFRVMKKLEYDENYRWSMIQSSNLTNLEKENVLFAGIEKQESSGNWKICFDVILPHDCELFSNALTYYYDEDMKKEHFPSSEKYLANITCLDLVYYVLNTSGETKSNVLQQAAKLLRFNCVIYRDLMKKVIALGN